MLDLLKTFGASGEIGRYAGHHTSHPSTNDICLQTGCLLRHRTRANHLASTPIRGLLYSIDFVLAYHGTSFGPGVFLTDCVSKAAFYCRVSEGATSFFLRLTRSLRVPSYLSPITFYFEYGANQFVDITLTKCKLVMSCMFPSTLKTLFLLLVFAFIGCHGNYGRIVGYSIPL